MEDRRKRPNAGNNPNVQSTEGGINPSAPATGTAGWGNAPDERRRQVSQNDAAASHPSATGAGDTRRTSYPQNEAAQNPAATEPRHAHHTMHCTESGCNWSVDGDSADELLGYLRAHMRSGHAKNQLTTDEIDSARRSIHKRAA